MELSTYKIFIEGTVQGVGFRPFVYQLALRYKLDYIQDKDLELK